MNKAVNTILFVCLAFVNSLPIDNESENLESVGQRRATDGKKIVRHSHKKDFLGPGFDSFGHHSHGMIKMNSCFKYFFCSS